MWNKIFTTGTHTSKSGEQKDWKDEDLDKAISSFNDPVPITPGHTTDYPDGKAPTLAWIDKIKRVGAELWAHFTDYTEPFKNDLKEGKYRGKSAGFTKSGVLHHVAALPTGGGMPAVAGLGKIEYTEFPDDLVEYDDLIEFEIDSKKELEDIENSLTNKLTALFERFTRKTPEVVMKKKNVVDLDDYEALLEDRDDKEKELKKANRLLEKFNAKFNAERLDRLTQEHRQYLKEQSEKEGRFPPKLAKIGLDLMNHLAVDETLLEFEEGDDITEVKAVDLFKKIVEGYPKIIEFTEFAKKGSEGTLTKDQIRDKKVTEYMKEHGLEGYEGESKAHSELSKSNPELYT